MYFELKNNKMEHQISKIALGGGCHWCTEVVFQSLKGITNVEQGFVSSIGDNSAFSEAVVIHFNSNEISLSVLIEIHLYTHKSTSNHSMRKKYRSAVYTFSDHQKELSEIIIKTLQKDFNYELVTKVYPFKAFKPSRVDIQNYYQKNPNKPFCKTFINPKLKLIFKRFSEYSSPENLNHLINKSYE